MSDGIIIYCFVCLLLCLYVCVFSLYLLEICYETQSYEKLN